MEKKEKIRVLQIVEDLRVGGLERVIATIVSGLNRSEFESETWCLAEGGNVAEELIASGFKVRILGLKSYHQPTNIIRLARLLRRGNFHIVHTHGYFASTFGRIGVLFGERPVIFTHVHSTYHEYAKRHLFIEKFLAGYTDKIICVSKAVQDFIIYDEGIPREKTCVIYNGSCMSDSTDTPMFDENHEAIPSLDGKDVVITSVASLTENKGHRILLDACGKLITEGKNVRLMIVGDGPQSQKLIEHAKELSISSKVIFAGQRKNVRSLLQKSDVFVLNSIRREGLGMAVIEAMALALPVVGTSVGGLPEVIIDQVSGFLVKPGDTNELYHALNRLAEDKFLRKQMGLQGRKIYEEKFTTKNMIRQIEELYMQSLERKGL